MDTPSLDRALSEEIKCPICFDQLTEPKMLPCQHTFCLKCLQDVAKLNNPNTIDCPLCKREYVIPKEIGITGFPDNRMMKSVLERMSQFSTKFSTLPNFRRTKSTPSSRTRQNRFTITKMELENSSRFDFSLVKFVKNGDTMATNSSRLEQPELEYIDIDLEYVEHEIMLYKFTKFFP